MRPDLRAAVLGVAAASVAFLAATGGTLAWRRDDAPPTPIDVPAHLRAQDERLSSALARVAPQRPGVADLYYVGFAGYAPEDVFYNEVRGARRVLDARFDAAGRSLLLVNRPETLDTLPLAGVRNLREALKGMARIMDPREDILFLLITSHGAADVVAVEFEPFPLRDLTARDVRAALDRAGLTWRVVVVSACFSGSFIDDLADDNTLVLTAAREDRTSFGCANGRDFTEFGRRFFDRALWRDVSFVAAFAEAKERIAAFERAEGIVASEPQIFEGAAIAAKLRELEERLRIP
jgi:hypothetical protein